MMFPIPTFPSSAWIASGVMLALAAGCGSDHENANNTGSGPVQLSPTALAESCHALDGKVFGEVNVTAAQVIAAQESLGSSAFCKVSATRAPFLDIEVDLPSTWDRRYWQNGGGGFNGTIPSAITATATGDITAISPLLTRYNAVYAASNGGNRAAVPAQAAPAVWASGSPEGEASATDYRYRSLETTLQFSQALIQQFYGAPAKYRYFNGCSNGGREAYIAAERWPADFDGIVSGCETSNMATQTAAWLSLAKLADTPAALSAGQYRHAYSQALAACDENDGLADGYLSNAGSCTFDPAALLCGVATASSDPALCLSPAQVQTLRSLLSPLELADGTELYAGFNWSDFSARTAQFSLLGGGFAMLATGDASWITPEKQAGFNLETDYPAIQAGLLNSGADHTHAGLAAYISSGKKLLSWHDMGDNLLSGKEHARQHALLMERVQAAGVADPAEHARMMLVPGNTHSSGKSLDVVDWATAIIEWVEQGTAPARLTYHLAATATAPARTLPVCVAPLAAHYCGSGDINDAASFTCQ